MVNMHDLSPTQYLIMEVLAARCRLGEHRWPFPAASPICRALNELARRDLIGHKSDIIEGSRAAWLTEKGRREWAPPGYEPPIRRDWLCP